MTRIRWCGWVMLDDSEFDRWRAAANDALQSAQAEAERDSHHWSCFLAEQAAQLALKAALHGVGSGAWGHDAVDLAQRLGAALAGELPRDVGDAVARLGRHYIATRYPDAHAAGTPAAHYTASDAAQALADASDVLRFVDEAWRALRSEGGAEGTG